MAPRILHLTRDFPPRSCGGISTAVGSLVDALRGVDVPQLVLSFDAWRPARSNSGGGPPGSPSPGEPGVLRLSSGQRPELHAAAIAAFDPTLVQVHHGMLWACLSALSLRAGLRRVLHVHVAQGALHRLRGAADAGLPLSLTSQRAALAEADAVLVPSQAARRWLLEDSAPADRLHVLPPGIELPGLPPLLSETGAVLHVGRFAREKGSNELFAAMELLARRHPGRRLVVAGGVPANGKAERRWLRRWATRPAGVETPGWLVDDELEAAWADAAVVLAPSHLETFGLSVVEAMARGRAVVATRCGAPEGIITQGVDGLLVPPRDALALADAASQLLGDPGRTRAFGAAAREAVERRWTWTSRLPAWLEFYAGA